MARAHGDASAHVSLAERLQPVLLLRLVLLLETLVVAAVLGAPSTWLLTALTVGTASLMLGLQGLRSVLAGRSNRLVAISIPLLLDTTALTLGAHGAGGPASPLAGVLVLQAVGVALLLSHETAVKNAIWATVLVLLSHEAQELGVLPPTSDTIASARPGIELLVLVGLVWGATLLTSSAAGVNERALRREERLATLRVEFAQLTQEDETPIGTAQALVETVVDGLGARASVVVDLRDHPMRLTYAGAVTTEGRSRELEVGDDSVLHVLAGQDEPRLLDQLDPVDDPGLHALLEGAVNVSVIPLDRGDEVLGALVTVHGPDADVGLDRRTLRALRGLASHAGLALSNAIARDALDLAASTDGLTGIPNRRTLDDTLAKELERARRDDQAISLVLLDVDHFKDFNDEHGHQAGDEALADVARTLHQERRTYDLAARYGGEEFAVVLPQTAHDEALRMAERLRVAVAGARTELPVTASFGVATTTGDATVEALVEAADAALYRAKERGRDRVVGADGATPSPGSAVDPSPDEAAADVQPDVAAA